MSVTTNDNGLEDNTSKKLADDKTVTTLQTPVSAQSHYLLLEEQLYNNDQSLDAVLDRRSE